MKFRKLTFKIPNKHELLHHVHTLAHCSYLGAVSLFAHGPYAYAAAGLLLTIVLGMFLGEEL